MSEQNSIHQFKIQSIDGGALDFAEYSGKKILVVNVASECGLTPQYAQLQGLYEQMKGKLVIIGFPANNFGGQEPGQDHEIKSFCDIRYKVTFPMTTKISVQGEDIHPIYEWLTNASKNGKQDSTVAWNFQKYLLDENGQLVHVFEPNVEPLDNAIMEAIK